MSGVTDDEGYGVQLQGDVGEDREIEEEVKKSNKLAERESLGGLEEIEGAFSMTVMEIYEMAAHVDLS